MAVITQDKITLQSAKAINDKAEAAQTLAGNTNQHFWFTSSGTDTGAHITELTQEDFVSDPTNGGSNLLARSNGIAIRDGLTELAAFGADGQTFNNEYGEEVLTVGRLDQETYHNKTNWSEYNNESPFVFELPWDAVSIVRVVCFDASYQRINGISLSPTLSGRLVTFDASDCTILQSNSVAYVRVTYDAVGRFPYFTLGSDGVGAIGKYSFREGENTVASGNTAHAEGDSTFATGGNSHAEGNVTTASGTNSHAEGNSTTASGLAAHAEGNSVYLSGSDETYYTVASGSASHAEGAGCEASGAYSHAQNLCTISGGKSQTAIGRYNVEDANDNYALIIGNGTATVSGVQRSNALTVDWSGNVVANGDITDGSGHTLSNIGKVYNSSRNVGITVANINTYAEGASLTLPAGTYIVYGSFTFNSATGARVTDIDICGIGGSTAASGSGLYARQRVAQGSGAWARLETSCILVLTAQSPVYVKGSATLTSTAQVSEITAVRIA